MSHPDNPLEDLQAMVRSHLQRYEQGSIRLRELAEELAAIAPVYDRVRGAVDDAHADLLRAAVAASAEGSSLDDWETALTEFRRAIW